MIKEAICEGSDVQDALKKAKAQLGLDETAEYEFEIIQTEEKKKFGLFGGRPAKVRVFIKDTPDERAEKFLRDVLDKMTLQSVEIEKSTDENAVEFNLSGEEVGFVIGRRGETLDALQYLTSLVANHGEDPYIKVTVNTGNYREKREKTLEILGRKLAFKAIKTGKKTSLEPMNPYERRIIHTAVQKVNGAISWSEGENAARHVVIGPDPKVKQNRRGGYQNNRRGGRRSYNGGKKSSTAPVNPDRVPLNEGGETGLY
ncbi:MAG: RNA-binding cell elongation regulator Jag/EloR, partial [Eubacteriales bacterium]|nr:RNA-binding cell elongation regulator Jag/EloR [Eubacteriales bacterium]